MTPSGSGSTGGASFFTDLIVDISDTEPVELQEALWDLVWAGEVTNDAFAPLRAPRLTLAKEQRAQGRRFARRRRPGAPQVQGRWSLTGRLFEGAPAHGPRMRAISELLLERYGIVTRETVLAEGIPGGFAGLYGELSNLETLGTARRGYFVEGLGGAQFALPGGHRAPARHACGRAGGRTGAGHHRPGQSVRGHAAVAQARGREPAAEPSAGRLRRDARRGAGALRGARRQGAGHAPRAGRLADRGRSRRWPTTCAAGESSGSRSSASTASPVVGSEYEELLIGAGFRQSPRRLTLSA